MADSPRAEFLLALAAVNTLDDLEKLREAWLGRKAGRLTLDLKGLGRIADVEERKQAGAGINQLKNDVS